MIIRKPTAEDQAKLEDLMREFWKFNLEGGSIPPELAPFEAEVDTEAELKKYVSEIITGPEYGGYLADEDGKLVGLIVGSMKDREGYKLNREGYIEEFFVVEARRGQGIGTKLFDQLVADFKSRGATHLALDAYSANQPAIDLYHQWGFVDSELVMRRAL